MRLTWYTTEDAYFDHLVKMVSAQFLYCKITIFHFHTLFSGNTSLCLAHAHSVEEGFNLHLIEGGNTYIYCLEWVCIEDLPLLFSINCTSHIALFYIDFPISNIKYLVCDTTVSPLDYFVVFTKLPIALSVKFSYFLVMKLISCCLVWLLLISLALTCPMILISLHLLVMLAFHEFTYFLYSLLQIITHLPTK